MSRRQRASFWSQADREHRLAELAREPDPVRLLARLAEFGRGEDIPACSTLLRLTASLDLSEPEADTVLRQILRARAHATDRLGRDPGLVWAALDYLGTERALLGSPAVVDTADGGTGTAGLDPRTGLLDPIATEHEIAREFGRTARLGGSAALLVVGFDPSSLGTTPSGSAAHSTAIDRSIRCLRRALRGSDVPGRSGPDELVALLPRTDRLAASAAAQRLRRCVIDDSREPVHGRLIRRTLSIGIACVPDDATGPEDWLHTARTALGRAREHGGDRIAAHAHDRRSSLRLPVAPFLSATALTEDGSSSAVRVVELGTDGMAIDGIPGHVGHGVVRVRFEAPSAWTAHGRIVRRDPRTGRTAIALAVRLPERVLGDVLEGRRPSVSEA